MKYLLAIFVLFFSCQKQFNQDDSKPKVLVSIIPYKCLVEKISGDSAEVLVFVPEKKSVHTFNPTAKQIAYLGTSNIYFRIGEPFEEKILPSLKQKNPSMEIVDLRKNISLLPLECTHCQEDNHKHSHSDLHLWLSPNTLKVQANTITDALVKKYPEHKDLYENNLKDLTRQLNSLDQQIKKILSPKEKRAFLTSHPAFAYFCKDYDCLQIPVEYQGKEPTIKHLEKTLDLAEEEKAKLVILIPQENNKGAKMIADKLKLNTVFFDPYFCDFEKNLLTLAHLIKGTDGSDKP